MHVTEQDLILYYYGETAEDQAIGDHLASCAECRSEYQKLQSSLALLTGDDVPERAGDYGSRLWQRLQPKLGVRRRSFRRFGLWPAWAAATIVLIVAAFVAGRFWPREVTRDLEPQRVQVSQPRSEQVLILALTEHFEDAEVLLTDLNNRVEPEGIAADRARARELLKSNRIYRQAAARSGEPGIASVLDDLELVLTDIAHGDTIAGSDDRLRGRFEGILFELRVIGSHMRARQQAAARERSRRSS